MKKLLALVLALVMTLGLATVSSNAAFPDAASVSLNEAVDVMSAVGVFKGDENGNFNPTGALDRASAAKLIAYLDLGEETAEALPAAQVFPDVPANHWAAKYIAYCKNAGYLGGDQNGNFLPATALNGYSFGKMILCVLGYDSDIEGFTGSTWSINVAKLMQSNKIADGITAPASENLTREQGAQYCLNALQATMVDYDNKGTTININGAVIASGASKAEAQKWVGTEGKDYTDGSLSAANETIQLCEKLYGSASLTLYQDNTSVNGKKGITWKTSRNGKIESVSDFIADETVIGSSSDATVLYKGTGKSLARKDSNNSKFIAKLNDSANTAGTLEAADFNNSYEVYLNGEKITNTSTGAYYWFDTTNYTIKDGKNGDADVNGNGVLIELIDTDDNVETAEKVYFTTYTTETVKKAPVVKTNTVDGEDYVYVSLSGTSVGVAAVTTGTGMKKASLVKGYEGLEKDDVVTVVRMDDGSVILSKITPAVGVATAKSGTTLTIDGTAVKASANADNSIKIYGEGFGNQVNFYYDAYGYTIYAEAVAEESTTYLLVMAEGDFNTGVGATGNQADVLFDDGTKATIRVNKVGSKTWGNNLAATDINTVTDSATACIYGYVKNSDGTYNLTAKTNVTGTSVGITKGAPSMSGISTKGDNSTIYIIKNKTGNGYTVYTGYKAALTVTGATAYALNDSNSYADVIFVTVVGGYTADSTKDLIYLLDTTFGEVYDSDGSPDGYTLDAIVNGAKGTVKADTNVLATLAASGTTISAKNLYQVTYSDGELSTGSVAATTGDTTKFIIDNGTVDVPGNGTMTFSGSGKSYSYTDDCKVYVINADADEVEVITVEDIDGDTSYTGITAVTQQFNDDSSSGTKQNTLVAIYLQK